MPNIKNQDPSVSRALDKAEKAPSAPSEPLASAVERRFEKRTVQQQKQVLDTVDSVRRFTDPNYDIRQAPADALNVRANISPPEDITRGKTRRGFVSPESFPITNLSNESKKAKTVLPAINAASMLGNDGINSAHLTLQIVTEFANMGDVSKAAKQQAQKLNLSQEEKSTLEIIQETALNHIYHGNFDKAFEAMFNKINNLVIRQPPFSFELMQIVSYYLFYACSQSQHILDKVSLMPNLRYAMSLTPKTQPFHWAWADQEHLENSPLEKIADLVAAQAAGRLLIGCNPEKLEVIHTSKGGWRIAELKSGESRLFIGRPPVEATQEEDTLISSAATAPKRRKWLILGYIENHIGGKNFTNQYRQKAVRALEQSPYA